MLKSTLTGRKRKKYFNKEKRENLENKFRVMIERRIFSPDLISSKIYLLTMNR